MAHKRGVQRDETEVFLKELASWLGQEGLPCRGS